MTPLAMALGGAFVVAAIAVADTAGWARAGERRGGYRPVVSGRPRDMRAIDAKAAEQRVSIMHMHTKQLTTLVNEAKATPIPECSIRWTEQRPAHLRAMCGQSEIRVKWVGDDRWRVTAPWGTDHIRAQSHPAVKLCVEAWVRGQV